MNLRTIILTIFLACSLSLTTYAKVYVVVNNNDSGPGSLREAILVARANNGKVQGLAETNGDGNGEGHGQQPQLMDTILFNIPDDPDRDDEYVITLDSVLPPISTDLVINGLSQNGDIVITLSGEHIPDMYGLAVGDPENPEGKLTITVLIEGIIFNGFRKGIDTYSRVHETHVKNCRFENLSFTGVDTHTHGKVWFLEIDSCYFENIDSTALMIYQAKDPYIHHSTFINNDITAITITDCQRARVENNTIKNADKGIIIDVECDRGWIIGNLIENINDTALAIYNSQKFYIEENTIINNRGDGIYIEDIDETFVRKNYIGTDSTNIALGNTGNGISVNGYSHNLNIEGNTIGANVKAGLYVSHTTDISEIQVNNNFIGTDESGTYLLGNAGNGIELDTAWNTNIFQNTIANNGKYGIKLNYGDENTFSQNRIYHNGEKPIFIDGSSDTRIATWPNNSILTPAIAAVAYNGSTCTVVVRAEAEYKKVELFEGDSATLDAFRYITDDFKNEQNGFWKGSFAWDNPGNLNFRATVTDKNGSTSEIGWSCYIVTDTLDARAGSLREALVCANYDAWNNRVIFDMPEHNERIIRPFSQLPGVIHPVTIDPVTEDSIIICGVNGYDYSGLVFTGNDTFGKTWLSNFTIEDFMCGLDITGSNSIHIENLDIKENSGYGIVVGLDIDSLWIENSMVHHNDSSGISIQKGTSDFIRINKNQVHNNSGDGLYYANQSEYAEITENIIHSNVSQGVSTFGGEMKYLAKNTVYRNILAGFRIDGTKTDSIHWNKLGFSSDTILNSEADTLLANLHGMEILSDQVGSIKHNEIAGNVEHGIFITGKNAVIENNYIGMLQDYTPVGNGKDGISGLMASNLTIHNNYIGNNQGDGILGCDSSTVTNNMIGGVDEGSLIIFGNHGSGIRGCLHSYISQNSLISNFKGGIVLDTCLAQYQSDLKTEVSENVLSLNSGAALMVLNTRLVVVENNIINHSDTGIVINRNVDEIDIVENLLDSVRGVSVFAQNSSNVNIIENNITNGLSDAVLIKNISGGDIRSNLLGTDASANYLGNSGNGISILGTSANITISENTIGANGNAGIYVNIYENENTIEIDHNYIGINEGSKAIQNTGHGIALDTAWNVNISQNTIAYNSGSGIDLKYGEGNTFSQNMIYHNVDIPIHIIGNEETWANNTIRTPSVAHVEYKNGKCTVVVKSEPGYDKIEVFKGKGTGLNTFEFVTDDFTHIGSGFWTASFDWGQPDSLVFTTTATSAEGNTSEVGRSCLIVNNTHDGGAGSLRDAIGCANYHPGISTITVDLTYNINKEIKPLTQLPNIVTPVTLITELSDSIIISGTNSQGANGLVFSGNLASEKSELRGLIISGFKNGVKVEGNDDLHLKELVIRNNSENGIDITGGMDSLWVDSTRVYANDSCGIVIMGNPSFAEVKYNQVNNNGSAGMYYGASSSDSRIFKNFIYANTADGFYSKNGSISKIDSNYFYGNSTSGIKINNTQIDSVTKNQIGLNDKGEIMPNSNGVEVAGNSDVLIYNNEIVGSSSCGMLLSSSNTVIRKNYIGLLKDLSPAANGSQGISGENATNLIIDNNYIGNNAGDGILGCNNSSIKNNKIGGSDTSMVFGNAGAGLRGAGYSNLYRNIFVGNAGGGMVLSTDQNKIKECLFFGEQPKAIDLPEGAMMPAEFGKDHSAKEKSLLLKGTAVNAQYVEIFFSTGDEVALRYVGRAYTNADGSWQITVPKGPSYDIKGANYYTNTATDAIGRTSELSAAVPLMDNLCGLDHYLPEYDRGESFICPGNFKRVAGKDKHYKYTWRHQYTATKDSIYSRSQFTEFYNGGLYILTVVDPGGCDVIDSLNLKVLTEPLMADFLMSSEAGVGDKIVLVEKSSIAPDSVDWDFDGAQSELIDGNQVITFSDTGFYEISLKAYVGTCNDVVKNVIYIGEESKAYVDGFVYPYKIISATVYPVPVLGQLTLTVELSEKTDLNISVFNSMGNKVIEEKVNNAVSTVEKQIDFSGYDNDVYYIIVSDGGEERRVIRIVKSGN